MDIPSIILNVASLLFGGGLAAIITISATRSKAESEAQQAHDKVWADRLDQLREEVDYERELNRELLDRNKELIDRNKDKENRFQEQTAVVRQHVAEVIALTKQVGELELELAQHRCRDLDCPWRMPPNAHTPPRPGVDRDAWHAGRLKKGGDR